jgi:hypothetical protein
MCILSSEEPEWRSKGTLHRIAEVIFWMGLWPLTEDDEGGSDSFCFPMAFREGPAAASARVPILPFLVADLGTIWTRSSPYVMACEEAVGSQIRILPMDLEHVLGPFMMLSK